MNSLDQPDPRFVPGLELGEVFAEALRAAIEDKRVQQIARKRLIGSVDQVSDNTALLEETARRAALLELYR